MNSLPCKPSATELNLSSLNCKPPPLEATNWNYSDERRAKWKLVYHQYFSSIVPQVVTLTATKVADPSISASIDVSLVPDSSRPYTMTAAPVSSNVTLGHYVTCNMTVSNGAGASTCVGSNRTSPGLNPKRSWGSTASPVAKVNVRVTGLQAQ